MQKFYVFWIFLISYAQPYLSETLALTLTLNLENPKIPKPKPDPRVRRWRTDPRVRSFCNLIGSWAGDALIGWIDGFGSARWFDLSRSIRSGDLEWRGAWNKRTRVWLRVLPVYSPPRYDRLINQY